MTSEPFLSSNRQADKLFHKREYTPKRLEPAGAIAACDEWQEHAFANHC